MRIVIQRVKSGAVTVEGRVIGAINHGYVVLLGIKKGDTYSDIRALVNKLLSLRLFSDDKGRFDRSIIEVEGGVLVVSQFTLYGDCKKGRRPSFDTAAPSEDAKRLYDQFLIHLKDSYPNVASGIFGASMDVALVNDGPVTFILDS